MMFRPALLPPIWLDFAIRRRHVWNLRHSAMSHPGMPVYANRARFGLGIAYQHAKGIDVIRINSMAQWQWQRQLG
eukprot:5163595-Alexandrium_andersonii.AAC.1